MTYTRKQSGNETKTLPVKATNVKIVHTYKQGDKVLLKITWKTKFNQEVYLGPYIITAVRNNGVVRTRKGRVTDTFNI